MEQTPPVPPPGTSLFEMELDAAGQSHLNTISKWGKFIAITGLIFVAIAVLALATQYDVIMDRVADLFSLDNQVVGILVVIMAIFGGLGIALLVYLLRASVLIRQGLVSQNSDRIADGFRAMKVVFIISIIFSSLSILSTLITLVNN